MECCDDKSALPQKIAPRLFLIIAWEGRSSDRQEDLTPRALVCGFGEAGLGR
jgi:hypothetical protein